MRIVCLPESFYILNSYIFFLSKSFSMSSKEPRYFTSVHVSFHHVLFLFFSFVLICFKIYWNRIALFILHFEMCITFRYSAYIINELLIMSVFKVMFWNLNHALFSLGSLFLSLLGIGIAFLETRILVMPGTFSNRKMLTETKLDCEAMGVTSYTALHQPCLNLPSLASFFQPLSISVENLKLTVVRWKPSSSALNRFFEDRRTHQAPISPNEIQ